MNHDLNKYCTDSRAILLGSRDVAEVFPKRKGKPEENSPLYFGVEIKNERRSRYEDAGGLPNPKAVNGGTS